MYSNRNLKYETIKILSKYDKMPQDIKWVGCNSFKIPIEEFWELSNRNYDAGYGHAEVASDLVIVGSDWWLERHEYDGAEWWEYKTVPNEPDKTIDVPSLFPFLYNERYFYLCDFYDKREF